MASVFPLPNLDQHPKNWSKFVLYAATILLESEGEPYDGKVGVAWIIRNRMDKNDKDITEIVLAPYQFSCWNEDIASISMRRARLIGIDPILWDECWRAASAAFWKTEPDPTNGSTHYLNVELTRQMRKNHDLPAWAASALAKAPGIKIGKHTFLNNVI